MTIHSLQSQHMDTVKKILKFFAKPITYLIDAWNNKTPLAQWYFYYRILEFIARTCLQLHCVFENKPIGPRGYVPGFFCFLHAFLQVYTTYFYIKTGDFVKCVPSYCVFGLVIAVSDKSLKEVEIFFGFFLVQI